VRRLTYHAALLRLARWDQVADHDQSGCYADPDLQRNRRGGPGPRPDARKPSPNRLLRVVLMSLRIAKVHEGAIPRISCDVAAKSAHGLGDAFLIGRNDLPQVLRVHADGESRRTDQVAEHHGDVAPLGFFSRLRLEVSCERG